MNWSEQHCPPFFRTFYERFGASAGACYRELFREFRVGGGLLAGSNRARAGVDARRNPKGRRRRRLRSSRRLFSHAARRSRARRCPADARRP